MFIAVAIIGDIALMVMLLASFVAIMLVVRYRFRNWAKFLHTTFLLAGIRYRVRGTGLMAAPSASSSPMSTAEAGPKTVIEVADGADPQQEISRHNNRTNALIFVIEYVLNCQAS